MLLVYPLPPAICSVLARIIVLGPRVTNTNTRRHEQGKLFAPIPTEYYPKISAVKAHSASYPVSSFLGPFSALNSRGAFSYATGITVLFDGDLVTF